MPNARDLPPKHRHSGYRASHEPQKAGDRTRNTSQANGYSASPLPPDELAQYRRRPAAELSTRDWLARERALQNLPAPATRTSSQARFHQVRPTPVTLPPSPASSSSIDIEPETTATYPNSYFLPQRSPHVTTSPEQALEPYAAGIPQGYYDQRAAKSELLSSRPVKPLLGQPLRRRRSKDLEKLLRQRSRSATTPVAPPKKQKPLRPHGPGFKALLYTARMVIFSIGVGVLAGTMLSAWDPSSHAPADASLGEDAVKIAAVSGGKKKSESTALLPTQPLPQLQTALQEVVARYGDGAGEGGIMAGTFVLDLDTRAYADLNGDIALAAASVIKIPVLVAFFEDVDAGKIQLDEMLVMRQELVAKEAGDMQFRPVGTKFSALETATKMITISDNTATNMLIDRLGGAAVLNERFKAWGLTNTLVRNFLPDIEGTNVSSAKDMALLLARVGHGDLLSTRSRDLLLGIMRKTVNNSLLPQGLGADATIAHKTGTIAISLGDAGLVNLSNGKRYAISVFVKRPRNDRRAYSLIQQVSQVTYQHFIQPPVSTPDAPTPAPSAQPTPLRRADRAGSLAAEATVPR